MKLTRRVHSLMFVTHLACIAVVLAAAKNVLSDISVPHRAKIG